MSIRPSAPHASRGVGSPLRRAPFSALQSFSLSVLLFLLPCLPSAAQVLKFRALSWQGTIENLCYSDESRAVDFSANEHAPSPFYKKTATSPLELYREVATTGGTAERQTVATVPPPAPGIVRALLLLMPEGPGRYAGRWLDDSPAVHPVHTLRIYNFSGRTLAFQAGSAQWTQEAGQIHLVPFDASLRQFPLQVAVRVGDRWEIASSAPLPVHRDYRVHLLLRDARSDVTRPDALLDTLLFHDYVRPAR